MPKKCRKIKDMTARKYFNILLVCFSWLWQNEPTKNKPVTGDQVKNTIVGLGVMTKEQFDLIRAEVENIFAMHCASCPSSGWTREQRMEFILGSRMYFVVSYPAIYTIKRESRLKLNTHLSWRGFARAIEFRREYREYLNREAFLAEFKKHPKQWDRNKEEGEEPLSLL